MYGSRPIIAVDAVFSTPQLHTAAGHRILEGWPRLRVQFTIPSLDVLTYPQIADSADTGLHHSCANSSQTLDTEIATQLLTHLYANNNAMPAPLRCLVQSTILFSKAQLLASNPNTGHDATLSFISVPFLLVTVLAVTWVDHDDLLTGAAQSNMSFVRALLKNVLERSWTVSAQPLEAQIPCYF